MKRPTPARLKQVTPENLERLGVERLAAILADVAETRVELKRRLRMELAAEQGPAHLLPEIDRRLRAHAASRSNASWRQRPAFVRDLDGLRDLIVGRLADLDRAAAEDRIFEFLALHRRAVQRVRNHEAAVAPVFARAAAEAVGLLDDAEPHVAGARLAVAIADAPSAWGAWAADAFGAERRDVAGAALAHLAGRSGPGWASVLRRLADAAGDPDAFAATFTADALRTPAIAADVAARFMGADRLEDARRALEAAIQPRLLRRNAAGEIGPDFDWETVWIDYLERVGRRDEAQEARWTSFERTLSAERARAFTKRLPDFEDVEAEHRIFEMAARQADAARGLELLMGWPAFPEAARMIAERGADLRVGAEQAERWAVKLRRRFPQAAAILLRRAAADAFRRREYANSTRLTEEADAISD
jgi:hypothetical protein